MWQEPVTIVSCICISPNLLEAILPVQVPHVLGDMGMSRWGFCFLFALVFMLLAVPTLGQETLSITVSTDRKDYDLGQVILITVRVQQFGAPVANAVVYFELRDPQNQVRASGFEGVTDSSGKISWQVMIGNDFPLGSYIVYISVNAGGQSATAQIAFQTIPEFPSALVLVFAFAIAIVMLEVYRKRDGACCAP